MGGNQVPDDVFNFENGEKEKKERGVGTKRFPQGMIIN